MPIEAPADLPADGRELWQEIVRALAEAGIIDRVDLPALRLFCLQYARAWMAHRSIDQEPDEEELAELDQRIQNMETISNALKTRIAGVLQIGQSPEPKDVRASADYERELTNLRAYRQARAQYGNLVALGSTGQLVEHPMVATERNASRLALSYASSFGLTPSDRARLGILITDYAGKKRELELDDEIGKQPGR